MANTAYFVQFPHPGSEHNPTTDDMPWNVGKPRRKFLITQGCYVDTADCIQAGELVFWGEWEPPSRIEHRWPWNGRLPRALHRPFWTRPAPPGSPHDTDPWVFGGRMLYSYGKQTTGKPVRRATSMQNLVPGSVICFGSTINGEFCTDTVFVVASAERWTAAEAAAYELEEAFVTCTAEIIVTWGIDAHTLLTLYRGATIDQPIHGMYSFVPAKPAIHPRPRFSRPPVHLPSLINPSSAQSPWGARRPMPIASVRDAWAAVRDQILAAGLVLATRLTTPPLGEPPRPGCPIASRRA